MTPRPHLPRQSRSSSGNPIRLRRRPDLVIVQTRRKHGQAVIVKDPIAMKYYSMRLDEAFVLERLGPGVTLDSLRAQYEQQYCPEKVTPKQLNDLLFRFHGMGLTLSDRAGQGERLFEKRNETRKRRWTQQISSVLFVRFPGVDPDPLLRRFYPLVRPLMSIFGLSAMLLLVLTAAVVLMTHWQRFWSEFPEMRQWVEPRAIVMLAAVVGTTKVLHELGHAFVCKHFGGECHEIGPMLLVFTPALYCDTSDSWTLPNRFARAAVGAAGIATEIVLASAATLIWASTGPTLIHYMAMNVMVVCSISTVLFNANPLLRYDGYYVLSDLCEVPNLGQTSRGMLARLVGQVCLGVPIDEHEPLRSRERLWLLLYATAAFVYRWSLTLLILWFLLMILRPYRLESVGRVLCLFAIGGLIFAASRVPLSFLRDPAKRRLIRMDRLVKTAAVIGLLVAAAWIPLPSVESATGRLVPRVEVPIFASTGGHLDAVAARIGSSIDKGDPVAELVSPEVASEFSKAESRVATQRELVGALRSSRLTLTDAANELPLAEATLTEFERQLDRRRERLDALLIRAPVGGRLIVPPRRGGDDDSTGLTLANWQGDPTESRNLGCFIQPGTELFAIVADDRWDAELIVTASQARRIAVGNAVKLVLESDPSTMLHGIVTELSSKQWNSDENRQRRDDERATRDTVPVETSYAVRIQIDTAAGELSPTMLAGCDVAASIAADPISIGSRLIRFLCRLFRIR